MAEANTRYFKHEPLDTTKQEIRLIRLLPPKDATDSRNAISCTLEHFEIAQDRINSLAYTALSYTWGEGQAEHTVYINGLAFLVRRNLYDFLCSMCELRDFERLLWIDQLCIDQEDLTERNHQVMMMAEIYSHAEGVVAWLGQAGLNSGIAMRALSTLEDICNLGCAQEHRGDPREQNSVLVQKFLTAVEREGSPGADSSSDVLDGMVDIMNRPYWSRLWIVQELYLAQSITLMCSTYLHPFSLTLRGPIFVRTLLALINRHDTEGGSLYVTGRDHWFWVLHTCLAHSRAQTPSVVTGSYNLLHVLTNFSRLACADPRDKVYGLQACVRPEERVSIDYSYTPEQVFLETVDKVFKATVPSLDETEMRLWATPLQRLYQGMNLDPAMEQSILSEWEERWSNAQVEIREAEAAERDALAGATLQDICRLFDSKVLVSTKNASDKSQ